ncbi:MAG: branched-chain amino acid ABC transporter permease [Pusillimonas sp.]|nr:branched-chain amino acid ABC transporter permease [Pusillimonas sp.]
MVNLKLQYMRTRWLPLFLMVVLAVLPLITTLIGQDYYITFASRVLVICIAAVGLNLVLGYGGMVSFGHALYVGIGAYAVAVLSDFGILSGPLQLTLALLVGGLISFFLGLIALRTSGIAFIMITLAFSQMFYYIVISLKNYGGNDGMVLASRSDLFGLSLESSTSFYYFVFIFLALSLWFTYMIARSSFGWILRGSKLNARRMTALGYPVLRYRVVAYVISALICIVAGFLLANLTRFASPSYLQWSLSGELIVIVMLGGAATVFGPLYGAITLLVLEELLANAALPFLPATFNDFVGSHFMGFIGLFIVLMAMGTREGLSGLIVRKADK